MTTAFPVLVPSGRSFNAGNFPVKTYAAQDGGEVRILYGNKRVGMTLQLTYQNIADASAKNFIEHFHEMKGTYTRFTIGTKSRDGWGSDDNSDDKWLGAVEWGSQWRYAQSPQLQSVYPGISTVTVNLIAALS